MIRKLERLSIRDFVQECADDGLLNGRVLDHGCGKSPYREIVERAGGDYWGWDHPGNPGYVATTEGSVYHMGDDPPLGPFDAIICTQVVQYVRSPRRFLYDLRFSLRRGGWLLMTGPTNWPIVEKEDRHRFTAEGIRLELKDAGFSQIEVDYRATVTHDGESWPLGWWAKGQA